VVQSPSVLSPAELYVRGASLRNIGMPMTLASLVLFFVGVGLVIRGTNEALDPCRGDFGCSNDGEQYIAWGFVSIVGSVLGLGVGIPLWAVGSARMRRAERMGFVPPTHAQPYVAPAPGGLVAGLRLVSF